MSGVEMKDEEREELEILTAFMKAGDRSFPYEVVLLSIRTWVTRKGLTLRIPLVLLDSGFYRNRDAKTFKSELERCLGDPDKGESFYVFMRFRQEKHAGYKLPEDLPRQEEWQIRAFVRERMRGIEIPMRSQ